MPGSSGTNAPRAAPPDPGLRQCLVEALLAPADGVAVDHAPDERDVGAPQLKKVFGRHPRTGDVVEDYRSPA